VSVLDMIDRSAHKDTATSTERVPARASHGVAIATGLYAAALLLMFGDVLFTRTWVLSKAGEDISGFFLHWEQFAARELGAGHVPLWNPHMFSGAAVFGNKQPAVAYPLTWLSIVLPVTVAVNLGIVLHFLVGAVGTFLWTRRRGLHPAASFLGGFVFTFCAPHFLQVYRGHLPNLRTLVWAPWILLAIDGVLDSGTLDWVLLGTAAVALQILAGHVQETYYTALIAGVYALLRWPRSPHRGRAALGLATMYAGAAALAAVQLGAGVSAVSESVRTRVSWAFAASFAFPPENLVTAVLPGLFGDMDAAPYWGRWTLSEMSFFVGCVPVLLAVYGAVAGTRERRRFATVMALIAIMLACGRYTPLFGILYAWLPGFASFRGTTKFTFLAALFVSMLTAIGFDVLLRRREVERWPAVVAFAAAALLLVAGIAVLVSARAGADGAWPRIMTAIQLPDDELSFRYYPVERGGDFDARAGVQAARSLLIAGATFLVAGALWLAVRRRRAWAYAIAVLGCVELLVYGRHMRPSFDAAEQFRLAEGVARFLQTAGARDARVLCTEPYIAMSAGTYDLWGGDDPMVLRRYAEFIAFTQDVGLDDLETAYVTDVVRLYGLLRLRYLLYVEGGSFRAVVTPLSELPHATLVSTWQVVADRDQRLSIMENQSFDPRRIVLLESEPVPAPAVVSEPGSATLYSVSSDEVDVRVDTPTAAILVIGDNYSAGWTAVALPESIQRTYTVMPADQILRAIPLAGGHHHFRLVYRPRGFVVGLWVTIAAVAVYALVAVATVRRRFAFPASAARRPW